MILTAVAEHFGINADGTKARNLTLLISGKIIPVQYIIMRCLNEELGGYGVEAIYDKEGNPIAEYINMGDTYDATVLYNIATGEYVLCTWGDWYEEWEAELDKLESQS